MLMYNYKNNFVIYTCNMKKFVYIYLHKFCCFLIAGPSFSFLPWKLICDCKTGYSVSWVACLILKRLYSASTPQYHQLA